MTVQEMNHQTFTPHRDQVSDCVFQPTLIQWRDHAATGIHPFGDLKAQITGNDRFKTPGHAIRIRPFPAPKFQHIAKPGRGDQPGARKFTFQNSVCRGFRAVHDQINFAKRCRKQSLTKPKHLPPARLAPDQALWALLPVAWCHRVDQR